MTKLPAKRSTRPAPVSPTNHPVRTLGMLVAMAMATVSPDLSLAQLDDSQTSVASTGSIDSATLFAGAVPKTVEELRFMQDHFAELAKKVMPAIVNIQRSGSQGSGVIVTSDGYVLTAAHVIGEPGGKADVVLVDEEGKQRVFQATTLGVNDGSIDSGMLKIDEGQGQFPYLDLGISEDLEEGQWVMAVGHPGGIDMARGLVVRVGRIIFKDDGVLRTDCTLVGGDSGGPLFDMGGNVIGIHSRIGREVWQNLHVPVDNYSENWDRMAAGLILNGKPRLGFDVVEETNTVESVADPGPASKAGLKKGDLIIAVDGEQVEDKKDINSAVKALDLLPNMKLKITVKRGDQELELELTAGRRT